VLRWKIASRRRELAEKSYPVSKSPVGGTTGKSIFNEKETQKKRKSLEVVRDPYMFFQTTNFKKKGGRVKGSDRGGKDLVFLQKTIKGARKKKKRK